jgi:hypothetical protein
MELRAAGVELQNCEEFFSRRMKFDQRSRQAKHPPPASQVDCVIALEATEQAAAFSVQPQLTVNESDFTRMDQALVCDAHPIEFAIQILRPKIQELHKFWKLGCQIVILPDEGLQQRWVVWHPVKYLRGRETVASELRGKASVDHRKTFLN